MGDEMGAVALEMRTMPSHGRGTTRMLAVPSATSRTRLLGRGAMRHD